MKTRITELLGIKYPILLSGMSWISTPKMVAAVSNAGGLGILATGPLNVKQTRNAVREIRELTDKPFGGNATLLIPGAVQNAKVLLEEKVPVINFALGKGDWIVKKAHEYGGKVLATVVNEHHGKRAQDYGTDALVVTGHEAAGHGGEVTNLVLIPSMVKAVKIPIIAAGGFCDGRGLAAALALGADGIAMGTRFMTTEESPLHENFKKLSIEKEVYDTLYSDRFDGIPCRMMKTVAAERAVHRSFSPLQAILNSRKISNDLRMPYFKLLFAVLGSGWRNIRSLAYLANGFKAVELATEQGDIEKGLLPGGQIIGLIKDSPKVSELMERIIAEAERIGKKVAEITAGGQ